MELDNVTLLYRVRKTLLQMLKDRGYIVSEKKLAQNKKEFEESFQTAIPNTQSLNTLVEKRQSDETGEGHEQLQKLAVFFPDIDKLNKAALNDITLKLIELNVYNAIIITKGSTSIAKKVYIYI